MDFLEEAEDIKQAPHIWRLHS